jgi:hypothetical protein
MRRLIASGIDKLSNAITFYAILTHQLLVIRTDTVLPRRTTVHLTLRRLVPLVLLLVPLGLCAAPLAYRVTPESAWKYPILSKTTLVVSIGEMPYNLLCMNQVTMAHRVQTVAESGNFTETLTYTVDKLEVLLNGSPVNKALPVLKPLTIDMTKLGAPVAIKGIEGSLKPTDFDLAKLLIFLPPQYPAQEVKVGEGWEATTAIMTQPVPMTGKVLAQETRDGVAVTRIENTFVLTPEVMNKLLPVVTVLPDFKVVNGKVTVQMTADIDSATGIPRALQGICNINGSLSFGGLAFPCKVVSTFTTDVPPVPVTPASPTATPAPPAATPAN